jgi:hypothetical protein
MTTTSPTHHRLFAYGELADPDELARIIGRRVPSSPAVLPGYRRMCLPGFSFPLAMRSRRGAIHGRLYDGLEEWDLRLLDVWETTEEGLYVRSLVAVEVAPGEERTALAYLGHPPGVRRHLGGPIQGADEVVESGQVLAV